MPTLDYTVQTSKTVDQAAADVERLSAEKGMKVLAVHDFSATLKSKGFDYPPMKVVEVCSAKQAYQILQTDPKISLMLPCPISTYSQDGQTYISTLLPTSISELYPNPEIDTVAREVETMVKEIVDEAK